MKNSWPSTKPNSAALLALCIVLWGIALILAGYGLLLFGQPGGSVQAILALAVAVLTMVAGFGLYGLRRWGVVLFGALGMLGSVSHLSNAFLRFASLNSADPAIAISSVISVLGAFLIPFGLIYLVLVLWRQAH